MTAVVVVEAAAIALLGVLVFGLLRTQARIVTALRNGQSPVAPPPFEGHPDPGVVAAGPLGAGGRVDVPGSAPGGRAAGGIAAPLAGVDIHGRLATWDAEGPAVLAFLTSGCTSCGWWWAQLRRTAGWSLPGVVVVTPDPATDSPLDVGPLAGPALRVIMSSDAWAAYEVRAGSTFVVVEGGRIRASGTPSDWDGLMALVATGLSE